jgi:hypothetical protein|tara:strand:- start:66 stop:392 length:327 start_codon:yes stop_codon:yes gene_type:complete
MVYQLVKSDQAPQIRAVLKREDNDAVVDFENGSCALKFRKKGSTTVLFTLAASDVGDNFKDGVAIFAFSGTQLAIAEGYYEGEISVIYSSGSSETVFKVLDFYLRDDF